MSKGKKNFWIGVALGAIGGAVVAQKTAQAARMPNAVVWQRLLAEQTGQVEAAIFMTQVESAHRELLLRRPRFEHQAFNQHVTGNILPGLALYQTWRMSGLSQEQALEQVDDLFQAWFQRFPPPNARFNHLLNYLPENFAFFRRMTRWVMQTMFPEPGWQVEFLEDNEQTLAFNIQHCFYLDILKAYGAPELTPAFCKLDDLMMALLPKSLHWGRSTTIGMGADCCNFRWDYIPVTAVETPEAETR